MDKKPNWMSGVLWILIDTIPLADYADQLVMIVIKRNGNFHWAKP